MSQGQSQSQAIMIRANVDKQDINICRFMIDRPLLNGSAVFTSKADAVGNALAENLFNIPEIKKVEISENTLTVVKSLGDEWNVLGKRIGGFIRTFLQPEVYANTLPTEELKKKVQEVLDLQINPSVAAHGGYVDLIAVENNNVYIRMGGGCQGCGAANMTLKMGIERMIRDAVPSIGQVLDSTDHASGNNPYYSAK
ncbi:MAG: NifU family protein [Acidobacteria bacterium]|nr:NifU family protein [Acidobacteriota bacterium]